MGWRGSGLYLSSSAGVSCRIWSHTYDSWYLPKFLFKEGSFTLVSFCALCLPVNYAETLGADWMSFGAGMLVNGGWGPQMFFEPVQNALPVSLTYSSRQLICGHLYLYMTPLFCSLVSLSLGAISKVLIMFKPLKCTCIPFLLHLLLNFSPNPCRNGTTTEMFLLLLLMLVPLLLWVLLCWLSVELVSLLY